jgi:GNAT superfamily N-acetyltransferase
MGFAIRDAGPGDLELLHGFIADLAAYEKLSHEVTGSPADLGQALFGPHPRVFALVLEEDGRAVGFAVWFYTYSTFMGRYGIWLEDLYVRPEARHRGYARQVFRHLARRALDEGCGRFEWSVLDWNEPAVRLYRGLGAEPMEEWTIQRLSGEALQRMAQGD